MKGFISVLLLCFLCVNGHMHFRLRIPNGYNVTHPCHSKEIWEAVGHMATRHTVQKNVFGLAFRRNGKEWTKALCMEDSDGDGLTNGEELGDPLCTWKSGKAVPAPVRGHPGFCEPDRDKCSSGMTHSKCRNSHAKAGSAKKRIRLPPGANDHPQTLKLKELMRMQSWQNNSLNRSGRRNVHTILSASPRWQSQIRHASNELTRPATAIRSHPAQLGKPIVGQSVFGQNSIGSTRNTAGSFNNRNRQHQPIHLSRDFGLTAENYIDGSSRNSFAQNDLPQTRRFDRQDPVFVSSGNNRQRSFTFHRTQSNLRNTDTTNREPNSFSQKSSNWETFPDSQSVRRNTIPRQDNSHRSRPSGDMNVFTVMQDGNINTRLNLLPERSTGSVGSDMQSTNRLQDNRRGYPDSFSMGARDSPMTGAGMPWASQPSMPGLARPDMQIPPGGHMRFQPFMQ
ncbi:hypothetical protein ACF0H5_000302 [Mactra antiquata]